MSIKKHRGVYEKVKGSGVWWILWYDEKGKRHRRKVGAKKDAIKAVEQKRARVRLALIAPELVAEQQPKTTLRQACEHRNDTSLSKPRTKKQEKHLKNQWEEWLGGNTLLEDITPAVLERWIAWRAEQVKPATVNRGLAYLKRVFSIAVKHGWAQYNPVKCVPLLRENNKKDRFFSPEEMMAILNLADPLPAAIIEIAVQTGMRQGEQFSLRRQDVNLTQQLVRLPDSKSGEAQFVYLNDRATELFRRVLQSHTSDWVFPSTNRRGRHRGKHMTGRWFTDHYFKPILERLEIEDAGWHTLRHTFASWLRLSGVELATIKELCRHSNSTTTERYAHLAAQGRIKAANSIQDLTGGEDRPALRLVK